MTPMTQTDINPDDQRSVNQINRMVRSIVEGETIGHKFWIAGIVKRYHKSDKGHIYFNLDDDNYSIRCMISENVSGRIGFPVQNELEIEVYGEIQVYEPHAEVQIMVENAKLIDSHNLPAQDVIEQLKAQGLYPPQKKDLPKQIRRVAIVTSESSRAKGDFENTYREENGLASLVYAPILLEGERAVQSIIDTIQRMDNQADIDIIAIVRGGGRKQELATFDDVRIATTIIQAKTYIVTGIGHHSNQTIADIVANYSAITPTAAATYIAKATHKAQAEQAQNPQPALQNNLVLILLGLVSVLFIVVVVLLIANMG